MRLHHILLNTLLILLSIPSITTATPLPSPPTTATDPAAEIEHHSPNAVHLATSFISLSHALSSQRLTKCPLDAVSINQTTSRSLTVIPKRGQEEAAAAAAVTPHLSPPSAHLSLKFIALGRGTQNYTCPSTNASAVPTATGAVATLYDVSCIAATPKTPALRFLHALPGFTRSIPQEVLAFYAVLLSQSAIIGEHYFSGPQSSSTSTTAAATAGAAAMPVFDLRPATFGKQGGRYESSWVKAKKVESVNAPGAGEGDVPWLKMVGVEGSGIKEIYRVHTAGGMSPATCAAYSGEFGVEYAAEYWFYG